MIRNFAGVCEVCPSQGSCVIDGALNSANPHIRTAGDLAVRMVAGTPCPGEPEQQPYRTDRGAQNMHPTCANKNMVAATTVIEMTQLGLERAVQTEQATRQAAITPA